MEVQVGCCVDAVVSWLESRRLKVGVKKSRVRSHKCVRRILKKHVIWAVACARLLGLHVKREPVVGARKLERDRMESR